MRPAGGRIHGQGVARAHEHVDAVEDVRSLVGQDAAGVVRVITPLAETVRIQWTARRRALPLFPIERPIELGGLSAAEIIVQPPGSDHSHRAQLAGSHDIPAFDEEVVAAALHAHLNDALGSAFGVHQFGALLRGVAQRLFDVHVLARRQGIQHHLGVPVLGGGDQHRLNVFVGQQLLVIAVDPGMRAGGLRRGGYGAFQVRLVHIANRADAHGGVLLESGHDDRAPASAADHAEHNLVRRRRGVRHQRSAPGKKKGPAIDVHGCSLQYGNSHGTKSLSPYSSGWWSRDAQPRSAGSRHR